jgi:hypothetical protein
MTRTISVLMCAAAILQPLATSAVAAEKVPPPSARALECAKRYSDAMHMVDTMVGMMNGMLPGMIEQERRRTGANITSDQKRLITEAVTESIAVMVPDMMDTLTPMMAASFTESELCGLADFYGSKDGQSIVAKMPGFSASSAAAMQQLVPRMQRDMEARICRKMGCDDTKRPTPQAS